jgi:division protein 1
MGLYDFGIVCLCLHGWLANLVRSGQVHRTLVGHTGPVTCLQFDNQNLVTGSLDHSVRIWDIRTGAMVNSYTQPHGVSSLHFDQMRIVSAAGEDVVSVYEREDERHWACGPGAAVVDETGQNGSGGSIIERVRCKESYLVEGRRDGKIGVWAC